VPPRIYFDNAATTPPDPAVLEAMEPYLRRFWGNPASLYVEGRQAREALDWSRGRVAALLGAEPAEIVFTSGGTEADNLALQGVMMAAGPAGSHLVTSAVEHPAVLECCRRLERLGAEVTRLGVDDQGLVDPADLEASLRPNTRLVSVMAANNVTGVLQPVKELAEITRRHGALFHTDAVQVVGKIDLDVRTLPVDLLALSGHKIHGPKGVGALYVRKGIELWPLLPGGGQEQGRRSGTENVAGIVGLGRAAELAAAEGSVEVARLVRIREHLLEGILLGMPRAYLIGHRWRRLPGHICMGLSGLEGQAIKLLLELDKEGIAISSGSACSAIHAGQPSHVLEAMGLDPLRARGSLRITLGRFNTMEEADRLLAVFPRAVAELGKGLGIRDRGLEKSPLAASAG
jgi:cysteine desulfurase